MSNLNTVIDFGSKNLRLGVFNQSSEIIYSSTHLVDVNVLYDSSKFNFVDLSIKKSFDQPILISKYYKSLVNEANFIVSENNFKDKILHISINNMIVDDNKKLENDLDNLKTKSLILELKFICLKKSSINTT